MPTRDHERTTRSTAMNPAARAFLSLSDDGTAELDSRSTRKSAAALAIMFLVLLAAPLYWASHSQAHATDQTLAVKHDGGNSGPGGGDDNDDDDGDDGGNDDNPIATHQGNTGPGASEHGGHHHGHGNGDDTNTGQGTNDSNENTATNTANTGDGPNTNTTN